VHGLRFIATSRGDTGRLKKEDNQRCDAANPHP
jgi:hypothetical protein